MATLPYQSVRPRRRAFVPPPRWLKAGVAIATVLILLVLLLGLPPARQSAALDYTRNISLAEAIEYSLKADWSTVFTDRATAGFVWFIPVALACASVFAFVRRGWPTITVISIALLLPFVIVGPRAPLLPLIAVVAFPALLGWADGETWSEGFVVLGSIGTWMILWAAVAIVLTFLRATTVIVEGATNVSD